MFHELEQERMHSYKWSGGGCMSKGIKRGKRKVNHKPELQYVTISSVKNPDDASFVGLLHLETMYSGVQNVDK